MNSPHQREQLPDLLSDALDPNERARVESHLRECPQCARELRQLEQMQAAVAALPVTSVPVSVRANVRAQLREKPRRAFVLPFAFPLKTSQLAWGGAAVVGAIGLMLLGRPSLKNDVYSQSAPVSETQMAVKNAHKDSAIQDKIATAKAPSPNAPGKVAPGGAARPKVAPKNLVPAKPAVEVKGKAPKALAPLPKPFQLPIAPGLPKSDSEKPSGPMPSFEFPAAPAPLKPPKTNESNSRPVAPNDFKSETKAKRGLKNLEKSGAPGEGSHAATKNAPPLLSAPRKPEPIAPKSQADNSLSQEQASARSAMPNAPINPPMIAAPSVAAPAPSGAFADDAAMRAGNDAAQRRTAPPADQPKRAATANAVAGVAGPVAPAASAKWPGGAVKATLAPHAEIEVRGRFKSEKQNVRQFAPPPKAPLVLTFGVAQPIGTARLILLAPGGPQTIWHGDLNALPAQVEISQSLLDKAKLSSGQILHARLEQIGGDDNPKSSSTFELLVP